MNSKSRTVPLCILVATGLAIFGCSHGLAPTQAPAVQTGFGGTIRFVSPWPHPPVDSVYDIRVVAFPDYPIPDILGDVETGRAKVYPSITADTALPLFLDSLTYSYVLDSSSTFQYVVVAMRDSSNLFSNSSWKVVGTYGYSHGVGEPKSVTIPANKFVTGINIDVDFQNVPPTPSITSSAASK